jgi:hypothetical protein
MPSVIDGPPPYVLLDLDWSRALKERPGIEIARRHAIGRKRGPLFEFRYAIGYARRIVSPVPAIDT